MYQGNVIVLVCLLMGFCRLSELGHYRAEGLVWVEPMGKHMHTHKSDMRRDPHDLCARGNRPMLATLTWASLATIEPPGEPPAVDLAQAHRKRYLPLRNLVDEHPTQALQVLLEQPP